LKLPHLESQVLFLLFSDCSVTNFIWKKDLALEKSRKVKIDLGKKFNKKNKKNLNFKLI